MTAALLMTVLLQTDARIMAEVILGEDPMAPTAIAWVIKNRAQRTGLPISKVVIPSQFHGYKPHEKRWSSDQIERATASALRVLKNERADPTGGAIYFHAVGSATPAWAPPASQWKRFGKHYFYK